MKPVKQPLNFLLSVSEHTLDNFRLIHMSAAANLRKEIAILIDKLIDELVQVELAQWFKENDREGLKRALETEEDALTWAKRMMRGGGEILPRPRMSPEEAKAHRVASVMKCQRRNIAEGKCEK